MDEDETRKQAARARLAATGREFDAARATFSALRDKNRAAAVEALLAGVPPKDVVALSRYTRETVRTLARGAGIEPVEWRIQRR